MGSFEGLETGMCKLTTSRAREQGEVKLGHRLLLSLHFVESSGIVLLAETMAVLEIES